MNPVWFEKSVWRLAHDRELTLGPKAIMMGVLNVTPDSFSDGGDFIDTPEAVFRAMQMAEQGASIIDVGGESTRPGSQAIDGEAERARVLPIIECLAKETNMIISVDTYRAETAKQAVEAGAHIVNDVWGCQREPDIAQVAEETGAGLCIMSTRRERQILADLLKDAVGFLSASMEITRAAGVDDQKIVLDPGFGFSPTTDHDVPILNRLEELHDLGRPLLIGTSRKRFLGSITGQEAKNRGVATAATSVVARQKGAAIFRVHDIVENRDALAVADAVIHSALERATSSEAH